MQEARTDCNNTSRHTGSEARFFLSHIKEIREIVDGFEWVTSAWIDHSKWHPAIYLGGSCVAGHFRGTDVRRALERFYIDKEKAFYTRIHSGQFAGPESVLFYVRDGAPPLPEPGITE